MLVFSNGFANYYTSNLISGYLSLPPSLCEVVYTVYTYTVQCGRGVYWIIRWGGGPQKNKTPAAKSI